LWPAGALIVPEGLAIQKFQSGEDGETTGDQDKLGEIVKRALKSIAPESYRTAGKEGRG